MIKKIKKMIKKIKIKIKWSVGYCTVPGPIKNKIIYGTIKIIMMIWYEGRINNETVSKE